MTEPNGQTPPPAAPTPRAPRQFMVLIGHATTDNHKDDFRVFGPVTAAREDIAKRQILDSIAHDDDYNDLLGSADRRTGTVVAVPLSSWASEPYVLEPPSNVVVRLGGRHGRELNG